MPVTERQMFCPACRRYVLARRTEPGGFDDLFVIIFTLGLALPFIILARALSSPPFLCGSCGAATQGAATQGAAGSSGVNAFFALLGALVAIGVVAYLIAGPFWR